MFKKRNIEFEISDEHQDGSGIFNEVFEMRFMDKKAKFEWNQYIYLSFLILALAVILNIFFAEHMIIILAIAAIIMVICTYLNNQKRLSLLKEGRIRKVRLTNTERNVNGYTKIKGRNAKTIMDEDCLILDVSIEDYYKEMHIKDAILLPLEEIADKIKDIAPSLDKTILVYSRSENRADDGAQRLVDLGYKDVYSFGSIMDWPFDVILDEE